MANFIVYSTAGSDPTQRTILQFGQCPVSQIAIQADGPNEVAIELASFTPAETGGGSGVSYYYDETDGSWGSVAFPAPDPPAYYASDIVAALDRINAELRASDWTQIADAPLTAQEVSDWQTFRANLRAVPDQAGWPDTITWPTPPGDFDEFTP